ncbi:MAG: phospho-sugar mutase [Verrucomicrobiaceae bacterium]|nr:phospho-sugar mutase [Verrucomicrobiaceae bacterium]
MSLEDKLNAAVNSKNLLSSARDNILALLAASTNPLYQASIDELVDKGQWAELNDRFFTTLKFGTGGLRGRTVGAVVTSVECGNAKRTGDKRLDERPDHPCVGTNAMNFFNVSRATRGLVAYIKSYRQKAGKQGKPSVVFAHDTRHFSKDFAEFAAKVANDHGADVYLFDSQRPTPLMSYCVRVLRADAGVMITASHNPPHDNGYKVNFDDGAGIVEPHAKGIITEVNAIKSEDYKPLPESERGVVKMVCKDLEEAFLKRVETTMLKPELLEKAKGMKVVFTAIHGTGAVYVPTILKRLGFDFVTVAEQDEPDGRFPTVDSPNPENAPALKDAAKLADEVNADAIIGTDPDCDRMGVGVRDPEGKIVLLTGNQTGSLIAWYRVKTMIELGILNDKNKKNAVILKTFVTSPMLDAIAARYGVNCVNTLTGFKWISNKLRQYEEALGLGDKYRDLSEEETRAQRLEKSKFLILGTEESYGYMGSDFSRDKDGNGAVVMFAEIAAYAASQGKSIYQLLDDVYSEIGYYLEVNKSCFFEGATGAAKIAALADAYAALPPKTLDGSKVISCINFNKDTVYDEEGELISREKMIQIKLEDGRQFAVRPSGTEPKIKYYMFASKPPPSEKGFTAEELAAAKKEASEALERLWKAIQDDIETRISYWQLGQKLWPQS